MNRLCKDCGREYDDAKSTTICPHGQFLSDEDAAQKDLAISLMGQDLHFAHEKGGPVRRIQSVGWDGTVTIEGMVGQFAPHLFVKA